LQPPEEKACSILLTLPLASRRHASPETRDLVYPTDSMREQPLFGL
jgi:hypothetical protein